MPRSPQRIVAVTGAVTILLLAIVAVALLSSRAQSRSDLESNFDQRATIAAALTEAILVQAASSSVDELAEELSRATITDQLLKQEVEVPGQAFVVTDADARVLAAWPRDAGRRGAAIPVVADEVRDVGDGKDWMLHVGSEPGGPVWLISGFETEHGRRVAATSYPRGLLQGFLGGYLQRIRTSPQDDALVVSAMGAPLATASGRFPDGVLRLPAGKSGPIELEGEKLYYASAPIVGTDWAVVVTTPKSSLYSAVGGLSEWLPWALLLVLGLVAGLIVVLVRRLAHGSDELARANAELARRNEEVVAADRMKTEFLATMSHELRTPLNGIIGFAELMHDARVGPVTDLHKEYLGDILTSAGHLRRLIDDVLDLSKIEAGKIDLRPETVDCATIVGEVCDAVGSLAVRKGIELRSEIDPAIDPLELDPGKLKQILFNYVSNALRFTPEGGTVSVRATLECEERFRIVVEDDGPGIPPEGLVRLWDAFEQVDTGSNRRHGGTGLGLSLTKSIVEAQGGEVGVESTLGVGSRFHVVLPRIVPSGREEPAEATPEAVA